MNINFSPVDEGFIKGMVEGGYYTNATEVIRDAVRRLREQDERQRDRLSQALDVGERAIRERRSAPYNPSLLASIAEDARIHAAEGGKPCSDVCP